MIARFHKSSAARIRHHLWATAIRVRASWPHPTLAGRWSFRYRLGRNRHSRTDPAIRADCQ